MFSFLPLSQGRRAAARFAGLPVAVCLLAACLCASFVSGAKAAEKHPAAEDSAPGQVPKVRSHYDDDPCPQNITPKTWAESSTFWRWVYRACKPEGAPARYTYTKEDAAQFLRNRASFSNAKREYILHFDEWAPNACRLTIRLKQPSMSMSNAKFYAKDAVEELLRFFRFNGRSPAAENMIIAARAFATGDGGGYRNLFAIYDPDTGAILYNQVDTWK